MFSNGAWSNSANRIIFNSGGAVWLPFGKRRKEGAAENHIRYTRVIIITLMTFFNTLYVG